MTRFKKGETSKEAYDIIMHDLESLNLSADKNNNYHYNLLKRNLKDIFGVQE